MAQNLSHLGALLVGGLVLATIAGTGGCSSDSGGQGTEGTEGAAELTFDASTQFKGAFSISGTITLPSAGAGRPVMLNVIAEGLRGNMLGLAGATKDGVTATYAITGLSAGKYKVQAAVDTTGNQRLTDTGDFSGYARGTVASPTMTADAADTIEVDTSVTGVDFGLGVVP